MKTKRACNGFILIVTLMILSLAMVLISFMINRSTIFFPLAQTVIEREKAKELALGGLQLASSQLAYADVVEHEEKEKPEKKTLAKQDEKKSTDEKKQAEEKPQESKAGAQDKQMLKTLMPVLGRWQTVTLDAAKDGLEGEIKICIMSEDGKINLNELYDFQKHAFVGSGKEQEELKKTIQEIFGSIKKASGGQGLYESLESFLKVRNDKVRDVTELLTIKGFESFKDTIFYSPDQQKSANKEKKPLYLTDIFTVWSHKRTIDPWLFSYSMRTIFNLPEPDKGAAADALKGFKGSYTWPADWNNVFSKIYKKDFNTLPKGIASLLGLTFGPETFSVLSYGTVGQITHRLFAVLERDATDRESKEPAKVHIKKLYWI